MVYGTSITDTEMTTILLLKNALRVFSEHFRLKIQMAQMRDFYGRSTARDIQVKP
jgi:hypothetical protein